MHQMAPFEGSGDGVVGICIDGHYTASEPARPTMGEEVGSQGNLETVLGQVGRLAFVLVMLTSAALLPDLDEQGHRYGS